MTPTEQAKAALEFIQHLHSCEDEGMASGQPSKEDCLKAREITDEALSALSTIEGREPVAWHKPGEFPPNPIPEHHILIGYSNRKDKDEDYSLRQLTMHPHKGPWADWYGCVPNPDRWAVIPIPDKHSARWFMPKRTPSLSVDEVIEVHSAIVELMGTGVTVPTIEQVIEHITKAIIRSNDHEQLDQC